MHADGIHCAHSSQNHINDDRINDAQKNWAIAAPLKQ
jgi:hypothetical protein